MFKKNGNGEYIIQKGTIALLMCIIALVSSIATVVAYGVTLKADVNFLKEKVSNAEMSHPEAQAKIDERFLEHERIIIVNQQQILEMHNDIVEIKRDVKELLLK